MNWYKRLNQERNVDFTSFGYGFGIGGAIVCVILSIVYPFPDTLLFNGVGLLFSLFAIKCLNKLPFKQND